MSSEKIVISARGLSKAYRIYNNQLDRIRQPFSLGKQKLYREFAALQDIDLDIRKGETIGIIGRNGSGKSTLLQLICGIRKPTSGTIEVEGRVSALLELGAGFHPEFTGRENVYMQGAIMGISRAQMEQRFGAIAAFADIGDFIEQPVKIYSSGMFLRLAFAVAVHVDPDILVIDEALAVGDARFQSKCFRRLEELKNDGATILIVSHATEQITRLCDRVLLFEQGRLVSNGDPGSLISQYLNLLFDGSTAGPAASPDHAAPERTRADFDATDHVERFHLRPAYNPHEYRWGDRSAVLLDFMLRTGKTDHVSHIECGDQRIEIRLKILFKREVAHPIFGWAVKSKDGVTLAGTNSRELGVVSSARKENEVVLVEFSFAPHLEPGDYFISLGVADGAAEEVIPLDRRFDSIHLMVAGKSPHSGLVDMSPAITIADLGHAVSV